MNNVPLESSLWIYGIHSINAEFIHLLESCPFKLKDTTHEDCLKEAIKCHHNDIANYIINNLLNQTSEKVAFWSIRFYNYSFFSDDIFNDVFFYHLCKDEHYTLVEDTLY
ncbi:hypothetical protein M9Y10_026063 [Tritrichomonas musculus]|uniref:DUF3447 domain-containing protein n=1 Tax=Tritrichomonas musculus TaxID=1915356 RepID=A0ABR2H8E0_9EUKA